MENNDILEFDSLCDKIRFAVSVGDELTEEMKKHIDLCEECRTFLEQSEVIQNTLGDMKLPVFMKNGKTVADSVMEEIKRQEIFTKGKPLKTNSRPFKHIGLVAACALIAVMAFPLVKNGVLSSKNLDAVEYAEENENGFSGSEVKMLALESSASDEYINQSVTSGNTESELNLSDTAQEECVSEAAVGGGVETEPPKYKISKTFSLSNIPVQPSNDVCDDAGETDVITEYSSDAETVVREFENYYGFGAWKIGEESYSMQTFAVAEEAAVYGAVMYCDGRVEVMEDTLSITYTDDGEAYAVFDISGNEKITVYMKKHNELWYVADVCDGDITE